MKKALFLAILAALPLLGQQEGSVAIAESIRPQGESATLSNYTKCVADLAQIGLKPEKAAEFCEKRASREEKASAKIANEAADATKASRPMVVVPRYGYGYGGGYSSYGYGVGFQIQTQRRGYYRSAPRRQPRYSRPRQSSPRQLENPPKIR